MGRTCLAAERALQQPHAERLNPAFGIPVPVAVRLELI
ncbi:hypothetical protein VD0001_g2237 [Verticillium dahliae]|nr:hypothetical protein VD0001_g2237 [Verticillium dahliae]